MLATHVGSLPKPTWLAAPEQLWAPWRLDGAALAEGQRDAVSAWLAEQAALGLDIVTDGEQTRHHFVHGFAEALEGVDYGRRIRMAIRNGRYEADVPVVSGPLRRPRPVYADGARWARTLSDRRLKVTLPGPMTLVDTLGDEHYGDREALAMAFAAVLNEEVHDLAAAGVDLVQIDEPAFTVYLDAVADWGMAALERTIAGVGCETAVHLCYGYGIEANIQWKAGLGAEWRQYEASLPLLAASGIGEVSVECINSRVPIELLSLLGSKRIQLGCIDVATDAVESADEVARVLDAAAAVVDPARLVASTNCGMAPMARSVAREKLAALVAGARLFATGLPTGDGHIP